MIMAWKSDGEPLRSTRQKIGLAQKLWTGDLHLAIISIVANILVVYMLQSCIKHCLEAVGWHSAQYTHVRHSVNCFRFLSFVYHGQYVFVFGGPKVLTAFRNGIVKSIFFGGFLDCISFVLHICYILYVA